MKGYLAREPRDSPTLSPEDQGCGRLLVDFGHVVGMGDGDAGSYVIREITVSCPVLRWDEICPLMGCEASETKIRCVRWIVGASETMVLGELGHALSAGVGMHLDKEA
jgi:hypothetical protein